MATRRQCIASRAFWRHRPIKVWSRSFTDGNSYAEESLPLRKISFRAQAQKESADAVQNLVRSRQNSSGVEMRSISLAPTSNGDSGKTPSPTFELPQRRRSPTFEHESGRPFRSRQGRHAGPRGTDSSNRTSRNIGPRRQQRPRTTGDNATETRPHRRKEEIQEEDLVPDLDSGGDAMTTEEHETFLKQLGHVKQEPVTTHPGPHLDMANLMIEYAPRHFGVTEPTSGQYPNMVDSRSRGLLQDIIKQVRKNETYTEQNIERLVKKLGPAMPRA